MLIKKDPKHDLRRLSGLLFNVGLVLSMGLVLMAFEWKTPIERSTVALNRDIMEDQLIEIPPTVIPPPPKPKVEPVVINEVDDEEIVEDIDLNLDIETTDETIIEDVVFSDPEPKEETGDTFFIVEQMPTFMGGDKGRFVQYIGKQIKYPPQARRIGIEGKVFVQFIVSKDGSIQDIQVLRGIGAGCDEEVMRVLQNAPNWKPGKQRGVPVNVKMIVPVSFKLN